VRRILLFSIAVLTAVAVGVSAHAASSPAPPSVSCKQKVLVFLFWPNGHGAIKSVGFAAYKTPHLEIYKAVPGYPNSAFLAFVASNKLTSFGKDCKDKGGKVDKAIKHKKTVTKQLAFSCSVPTGALIATKPVADGLRLDAGTPGEHIVSAAITTSGSTFSYDAKRCSSGPSPH
jgi:hypothetical protein